MKEMLSVIVRGFLWNLSPYRINSRDHYISKPAKTPYLDHMPRSSPYQARCPSVLTRSNGVQVMPQSNDLCFPSRGPELILLDALTVE